MGESLEAEVTASRPGWRAWVVVEPVMRGGRSYKQALEEWTPTRVHATPYDPTIQWLEVRYVELSEWHLDERWRWDLDLAIRERPTIDQTARATTMDELERMLEARQVDPDTLCELRASDYPDPSRTNGGSP
jgi:hypothetical protein